MLNLASTRIGGVFAASGVVSVASVVGFVALSDIATRNGSIPITHVHQPRKSSWTVVRVRPAWCPARHKEAE